MGSFPSSLADIQNDALKLLSEAQASPAGQLTTGSGGAAVKTTYDTLRQLYNQSASEFCRMCYPVEDVGVYAISAGTSTIPFALLACTSGNTMWAARGVKFATVTYSDLAISSATVNKVTSAANPFTSASVGQVIEITGGTSWIVGNYTVLSVASGVATMSAAVSTSTTGTSGTGYASAKSLTYADRSLIEAYSATWMTDVSDVPKYWMRQGNDGIRIYPRPSTGGTVVADGFALPKYLNNGAIDTALAITAVTNANPAVVTTGTTAHNLVTGQKVWISGAVGSTGVNGNNFVTVISATTFSVPVAAGGAWTSGGTVEDVPTWAEPDVIKYITYRMCALVGEKNQQRSDLSQRAVIWQGEYMAGVKAFHQQLVANDPLLCLAHFPTP